MSNHFTESTYESAVIELFTTMGYTHIYAPDLNRDYHKLFEKMYCYSLYNRL